MLDSSAGALASVLALLVRCWHDSDLLTCRMPTIRSLSGGSRTAFLLRCSGALRRRRGEHAIEVEPLVAPGDDRGNRRRLLAPARQPGAWIAAFSHEQERIIRQRAGERLEIPR